MSGMMASATIPIQFAQSENRRGIHRLTTVNRQYAEHDRHKRTR